MTIKKKLFITILFTIYVHLYINAQCYSKNEAFKIGERIEYEAYYNWGMIWLHAGTVVFQVNSGTYNHRPVYHMIATGNTLPQYEWLYKVVDKFESKVDTLYLRPLWFEKLTDEGGWKAYEQYTFNYQNKEIYSSRWHNKLKNTYDTLKYQPCTSDLLNAIYYCRNIKYENLKINQQVPLTTIIDGKIYNLFIRFLGKEPQSNRQKQWYNCLKFSVLLVEGTLFKGGEQMYVWVTDDANHIPILIESQILVGSVKGYFKSAENLKNPMNSKFTPSKK